LLNGSAVRDSNGKILYFVAQIQDITERRTMLEKLELHANQDYLTGLSNRRHFLEQGEIELSRVQRYGEALSVFMLDIDHFKNINDTHGHKAGDTVLQQLSQVLRETLRTADIIGRMGGEEFAILLPETDLQEAAEIAERLREIVARRDVILEAGLPLHITVSIGVVTLKDKGVNLDILLNLADKALYQAKASGRNRVCVSS
jgi:diguanylate cyclase (GGDEF)-like protein